MHKSSNVNDTRKELYEKFQGTRGALTAFCRTKGITDEWLRLVFKGEYEDLDLLIEAADFLKEFKANREAERENKQMLLTQKVSSLSMA